MTFWVFTDVLYTPKIYFQHHGIDHDPDQNGHGQGDPGIGNPVQRRRQNRDEMPQQHACRHAEKHPRRQIPLKKADAFL